MGQLHLGALALHRVSHRPEHELPGRAALDEVVLRALVHRLHGELLAAVSAEHDDRQVRSQLLDAHHGVQPVRVRQAQIQQHAVGLAGPQVGPGRKDALVVRDLELGVGGVVEHLAHQERVIGAVLDQQDPQRAAMLLVAILDGRYESRGSCRRRGRPVRWPGRGHVVFSSNFPAAFNRTFVQCGSRRSSYSEPAPASTSEGTSISRLRILPVGPLGSSSMNHTLRGYLYAATSSLT